MADEEKLPSKAINVRTGETYKVEAASDSCEHCEPIWVGDRMMHQIACPTLTEKA